VLATHGDTSVLAERDSLEDAISDLVENAIKHSPRASRVDVTSVSDDGWCTLEVTDAGPGIAAGLREVILRPGVRVVGSTILRGTGQGLAIVASILDQLGGRLEIADAPGGGAAIRMVLPHHSKS
jgi:signal transduction histidine kinase